MKNERLTPREALILKEIASGDPDKWISERHGISRYTLAVHKQHIQRKLNLRSKCEMIRYVLVNQNE